MKQILLFLLLAFAFSAPLRAQKFFDLYSAASDTLVNQTTKTYSTTPATLESPYYYSIQVKADSLSGSISGFCYLQVSNDRAGTLWSTIQTLTIDGVTSTALWEGIVYARRVRVYFSMPSGTRKVKPTLAGFFKRAN